MILSISCSFDNTFMIPDLSSLPSDLSDYIEQELIDFVTMNILEKTGKWLSYRKHQTLVMNIAHAG